MDLSETDFLNLKSEQCILVDFQGFPPRLLEMLELCMNPTTKEDKNMLSIIIKLLLMMNTIDFLVNLKLRIKMKHSLIF